GIFIRGKACPKCGGSDRHRIRRSIWMRFLPGSRYYLCEHCEVEFFSVLDLVSINWPFGKLFLGLLANFCDPRFPSGNYSVSF
ncbi:MAG: hypothetical protein WBH05_04290, partial [Syntrophobacteria bacterium]